MNKTFLGLLFITAGVLYGSLALDNFYNNTLGWLVERKWIKPPAPGKSDLTTIFGRKPTILLYSAILIIMGLYLIWNRNL